MHELLVNGFICFVGLALHFAMKWAEARSVSPVGFLEYAKSVPAVSAIAILSTVGAFSVTLALEWINPGMAFACGYMGNSVADNLVGQFSKMP